MQFEVLGERYQIQDPIGRGGMATIYRGCDLRMDHHVVAIKILREAYSTDPKFVTRFQREAKAASSLQHPNIVQVYDYGQSGGNYFIVMEYIDGTDLRRYLRSRGVLAVDRAIIIAHDVALGLGAAHRRQIVHRDVKPQNVLVGRDGSIKLTDFGIASVYKDINDERLTTTGMTLGTVQYYAPEQAQGEIVHPAADVYALGIVMYEMLTGRTPFDGDTAVAVAMQHIQDLPTPPSQYNPAIPPAFEEIIMRCLEKIPEMRYRDGNTLARALEMLGSGNPPRLRLPGGSRSNPPSNPGNPPSHPGRMPFPPPGGYSERRGGFPGASHQHSGMTPNPPPNPPSFPPNPALGGEDRTSDNLTSVTPEQEREIVPQREVSAPSENMPSDVTVVIEPPQVGTYTPSSINEAGETRPFRKNEMEQRRRAKESRLATIVTLLILLATFLLLGFSIFLAGELGFISLPGYQTSSTATPSPHKVTVPRFIDMTYVDAKAKATSLGLKFQSEQNLTVGTVIKQSPAPSQVVDVGTVITVVMSDKPSGKNVPNLVGMSLAEAQDKLKSLGIQYHVVPDPDNPIDPTKAANTVTRTDPPATQSLSSDQTLRLYVTNYDMNPSIPSPTTQPTPSPTPTPAVTPTPTPTPTPTTVPITPAITPEPPLTPEPASTP